MNTIDEIPFVNEECGDTMWNEENLNPPKSRDEPRALVPQSSLETAIPKAEPGEDA